MSYNEVEKNVYELHGSFIFRTISLLKGTIIACPVRVRKNIKNLKHDKLVKTL